MPPRINLNSVLRGPGDTSDVEVAGGLVIQGTAIGSAVLPATALVLAGSGTITPTAPVYRLAPAAAVTGIIMAAGTYTGQKVTLINTSAFQITFAATGTSNVNDGVAAIIAPLTSMSLTWDSVGSKWYHDNAALSTTASIPGALFSSYETIAAAGSTQGTGAAVSAAVLVHQVTASNGTTCITLPVTTVAGSLHIFLNTVSAQPLIVFPGTGVTINGGGANAAATFAATGAGVLRNVVVIGNGVNTWIGA